MNELLNAQNVTVIGVLLTACAYLVKTNDKNYSKIHEQNKEEKNRLISELREMKDERKDERKEWLEALNKNTQQLENVADKLETIPSMQKDLDNLKEDVQEIKNKLK